MKWTPNPESVMSANPLSLTVVKLHTMEYHRGEWPTHSLERVKEKKKQLKARDDEKKSLGQKVSQTVNAGARNAAYGTAASLAGIERTETTREDAIFVAGAAVDMGRRSME